MKILLSGMTIKVLDRVRHFAEEQPCLINQELCDSSECCIKPMVTVHSVRLQNELPFPSDLGQFVMMFEIEVEVDESDPSSVAVVRAIMEIVYDDHGIDFS